jgi:hypothetical protein
MAEKLTERQARIKALEAAQKSVNEMIERHERLTHSVDKVFNSNNKKIVRHLLTIERGIRQKILNNQYAERRASQGEA